MRCPEGPLKNSDIFLGIQKGTCMCNCRTASMPRKELRRPYAFTSGWFFFLLAYSWFSVRCTAKWVSYPYIYIYIYIYLHSFSNCFPILVIREHWVEFRVLYSRSLLVIYFTSKFGKLSSGHRTGKGQFSFQSLRKAIAKNAQTTAQLHSSHTQVKWCLKFSKPGFSSTWTVNFQMFKLVLEKAEEPEIKLPTSSGSSKNQERSRKTSISSLLTMPKPLTVWITINCENSERDGKTRPPDLLLEKSVCRSGSNS